MSQKKLFLFFVAGDFFIFPFPGGVMGNIFWENSSGSPNQAEHKV